MVPKAKMSKMTPMDSPLKAKTVRPISRVIMTPSLNMIGRNIIAIRRRWPTPNVRP